MNRILSFLRHEAGGGLLSFASQKKAAARFSVSLAEIEKISLAHDILPARYLKNRHMISTSQQLTLLESNVAVIGCGGLGGYIIEELARLGIGNIIAVDPDVFTEHNLNRQLYCTVDELGSKKVSAAARRVPAINPVVRLQPVAAAFTEKNGPAILQGVDAVADALDSVSARLCLSDACRQGRIPLVHGAIDGWYGQVAVQYPGEDIVEGLYRRQEGRQAMTTGQGNPSFTPALVASIETAEIVKILLQTGRPLRGRYLSIDLLQMEIREIPCAV